METNGKLQQQKREKGGVGEGCDTQISGNAHLVHCFLQRGFFYELNDRLNQTDEYLILTRKIFLDYSTTQTRNNGYLDILKHS